MARPLPSPVLLAVLLAGCASGSADSGREVPEPGAAVGIAGEGAACDSIPSVPFRSQVDPATDSRHGSMIRLYNLTGCTLRVTWLVLRDCDNVMQPCGQRIDVDAVFEPGRSRTLYVVVPQDRNRSWAFRFRYDWERAD